MMFGMVVDGALIVLAFEFLVDVMYTCYCTFAAFDCVCFAVWVLLIVFVLIVGLGVRLGWLRWLGLLGLVVFVTVCVIACGWFCGLLLWLVVCVLFVFGVGMFGLRGGYSFWIRVCTYRWGGVWGSGLVVAWVCLVGLLISL